MKCSHTGNPCAAFLEEIGVSSVCLSVCPSCARVTRSWEGSHPESLLSPRSTLGSEFAHGSCPALGSPKPHARGFAHPPPQPCPASRRRWRLLSGSMGSPRLSPTSRLAAPGGAAPQQHLPESSWGSICSGSRLGAGDRLDCDQGPHGDRWMDGGRRETQTGLLLDLLPPRPGAGDAQTTLFSHFFNK